MNPWIHEYITEQSTVFSPIIHQEAYEDIIMANLSFKINMNEYC